MISTGRDYKVYQHLPRITLPYFSSNNATILSVEDFISLLKDDGWDTSAQKDSVQELENLSKEELLGYFKNQGWLKNE